MAATDEAGFLEAAGVPVYIYPSSPKNHKLTLMEDLEMVPTLRPCIGHGYDVHRFDDTRPLYLGGILIPDTPGLKGHSDADVAIHALIDAMLGAAGLGDIGQWFPDNDDTFKGIRSTELLQRVWQDLQKRGYTWGNGDITIEAQAPRLSPWRDKMKACLCDILGNQALNIKATTTEKLGFVGRKEGIAATAVVLLMHG